MGRFLPTAGVIQPEAPPLPDLAWADEGRVVDTRLLDGPAPGIHGGTDFVAMDCRIRATSGARPRLGETHMSSRPAAPRRPAEADAKREPPAG